MINFGKLKKLKNTSSKLILNIFLIIFLSLISIYTTTFDRTMSYFIKEIIFVFIGFTAFFLISLIDYRKYSDFSKIIYAVNIILLILVFAVGTKKLGAQRWIDFGFVSFQPSEFSKILVILTLSGFVATSPLIKKSFGFKKLFFCFLHILPILALVGKQPDLGTTLAIVFLFFIIAFVSGINLGVIIVLFAASLGGVPLIFKFFLKAYQQRRILTFLNPELDKLGSGWNVIQSKIAVGSGGILGKGIFNSTQSKLRFLPEAHTDFIGSVYLEQLGFIGGIILLGLFLWLVFQIMDIGDKARDDYGKYICYGIAGIIVFHVFVNLGMIMGIMPVTGKPLLFMSYGGSSLVLSFIMLGIVQSVKIHRD
ncbi:MAG: rod shape-determining protein RodA [Fusobacteriaceae bacterium]